MSKESEQGIYIKVGAPTVWKTEEKKGQLSATCQKLHSNQFQLLLSALIFLSPSVSLSLSLGSARALLAPSASSVTVCATTGLLLLLRLFFCPFVFFLCPTVFLLEDVSPLSSPVPLVVGSCPLGQSILLPLWLVSLSFFYHSVIPTSQRSHLDEESKCLIR